MIGWHNNYFVIGGSNNILDDCIYYFRVTREYIRCAIPANPSQENNKKK